MEDVIVVDFSLEDTLEWDEVYVEAHEAHVAKGLFIIEDLADIRCESQ